MRCTEYRNKKIKCCGTGILRNGIFQENQSHEHPRSKKLEEDEEFKTKLRTAMYTPGTEKIKDVYDKFKAQ